ncbi:MAG: S8 family serine peptidase [Phycisphaerales bacterium]
MKVQLLAATSLAAAVFGLASIPTYAVPQSVPGEAEPASFESRGLLWTLEPIGQPKRKVKGRKLPSDSLVVPIDPVTGENWSTGRLIVKFRDELGVRATRTPSPLPVSLNGSDLTDAERIIIQSGSTVQQWINRTPDQLATLAARAETYSGRPQPDLSSIVFIDPPAKSLVSVARALNDLDDTDWVVIERRMTTMQQGCDPQNPVICNAPNPECACTVLTVKGTPECAGVDPGSIACTDPCAELTITDGGGQGCNPDPGGTMDPPNDQYGCADANCCDLVGSILPDCIDVDAARGWDSYCAAIANIYCFGTVYDSNNEALGPNDRYDPCLRAGVPGDGQTGPDPIFAAYIPLLQAGCFEPHVFGGCNQPECCNSVCLVDETCCSVSWDSSCVTLAFQNPDSCLGDAVVSPTPNFTATVATVEETTLFGTVITAPRARGLQAYTVPQPVLGAIAAPITPGPGTEFLLSGFRGGGFNLAGLRDLAEQYSLNYQGGVEPINNGRSINVAVIEFGAFVNHEDFVLATPASADGTGGTPLDQPKVISEPDQTIILLPQADTEPDHGTACLGEIVAADNGFGVTGIAHEAQGWFFPIVSLEEGPRLQTAIVSALETFGPGDVMSFSIGPGGGPYCGLGTHPTLVSDPAIWTLIRLGTDLGITSCIAAGNSSAAVEAEGGEVRSGALIVGACWPGQQVIPNNPGGAYCRLAFSCWHAGDDELAVVDLMAWGTAITTTGYGALFNGKTAPDTPPLEADRLRDYTAAFNGTSGATPMIAGLVACLQGWSKQIYGDMPLSPEQIGAVLKSNGFQQCSIPYGSPNFPGNDECPAAGDVVVGDGAETRHRIGQSPVDPANSGFFPDLVGAATATLTSISWPSLVTNYRVITGTERTPRSPYRLRADDGISVELATERRKAGASVAGIVYLTGGWITDIQVQASYDGNLEELIGLGITNVAAASRPSVIRICYVRNFTTNRWRLVGVDVMPEQFEEAAFAVDPFEDVSDYVDPETGAVEVRFFTAGLGATPSHLIYHDFVQVGPNPFIPIP